MNSIKTALAVAGLTLSLSACNGGLQNTLNAHPAPPAVTPTTVASVALSLNTPLNVNSNGSYAITVVLKDANGSVIPAGTVLANAVTLSTNDASSIGLELNTAAGTTATPIVSLTVAQPQIYALYTVCTNLPCPAADTIVITATTVGIAQATNLSL
jgi:hypothetical protein